MFLVSLSEVQDTDIMTYDTTIKGIDKKIQRESKLNDIGKLFSFHDITDHRTIKGSSSIYEVLLNWEDRHATLDPVSVMIRNCHIYLVKYAIDNKILDNPGWKQLRRYVNNTKNMNHLPKSAKVKQTRNTVNIKFVMNIPREHREAMIFDFDNGNTNWKDAELLKIKIYNLDPFDSLSPINSAHVPPVHTKIQVHLIYDHNEYWRYKTRIVASGIMNGPNLDTYYSSFILLRSMRIVVFLDEFNKIETHTGDISNAYLTARTTENIVLNYGPEFSTFGHEYHFLLIKTALYGLNSSGARFYSCISDTLTALGFVPSMVGCDIWMHNEGDY